MTTVSNTAFARMCKRVTELDDGQLLALHRMTAALAQPIYTRHYPGQHKQGMAAARGKRQ